MLAELSAMEGMEEADFVASLICQQYQTKAKIVTAPIFRESSKDVRAIIFERIEETFAGGVIKRHADAERWNAEAIEDARSQVAERKQAKAQRWFLVINGRKLGSHRVDKLREWVALGVLSEETSAVGEKTGEKMRLGSIPHFSEYPPTLRKKLSEYAKVEKKEWMDAPATEAQLQRLDFFGLPYSKDGLTKGRASELIRHIAFIDPAREKQYTLAERVK
jgi:hypothetical protein